MSMFTIGLKNLALTALKTGVQYALPALNDWALSSKESVAAVLESGQVVRSIILQDGTPVTVTVHVGKIPGLTEALQRHLNGDNDKTVYTNQLINIDHEAITVSSLGGMFSLAGLVNVGW